jgi:hypothetical protein
MIAKGRQLASSTEFRLACLGPKLGDFLNDCYGAPLRERAGGAGDLHVEIDCIAVMP